MVAFRSYASPWDKREFCETAMQFAFEEREGRLDSTCEAQGVINVRVETPRHSVFRSCCLDAQQIPSLFSAVHFVSCSL